MGKMDEVSDSEKWVVLHKVGETDESWREQEEMDGEIVRGDNDEQG